MGQWLRSLVFVALIYLAMAAVALVYLPWAIAARAGAVAAAHAWCRIVTALARVLLGLQSEVRGTVPTGAVLVAAKHQSFFDIILIFGALPRPRFIMKRELIWAPLLGQYALRIGCIPVDRGKRGQAVQKMLADVAAGRDEAGQLVIYPQGTRIAPRARAPYKIGSGALYAQMGQACVPVACNVGLFWPKRGIAKRPGRAVVEFLPPIPPGLPVPDFMARLEAEVEVASDRLMDEGEGRRP